MLAALFLMDSLTGHRLSPLGLALALPLSYSLNYYHRKHRQRRWQQLAVNLIIGGCAILGMVWWQLYAPSSLLAGSWLASWSAALFHVYLGFNSETLALFATGLFWWQGWRLSGKRGTFREWGAEFQLGVALWILLSLVARLMRIALPYDTSLLVLFLFASLLGMALSRLKESPAATFSRFWLGLSGSVIAGVILLGFAAAILITPAAVHEFSRWVLFVLKWLWAGIVWFVETLARLFPGGDAAPTPAPPLAPAMPSGEEESFRFLDLPPWLKSLSRGGWTVAVLVLVMALLGRLAYDLIRWFGRAMAHHGETVEPMPGAAAEDFRKLWRRVFTWLTAHLLPRRRAGAPSSPGVSSIRMFYREVLLLAAKAGHERLPSHTPSEYLRYLLNIYPVLSEELEWVTQRYLPVRYGDGLLAAEEASSLEIKWSKVKLHLAATGRKRK